MDLKTLQQHLRASTFRMKKPVNSSLEVVMAIIDELGEFMEDEPMLDIDFFSEDVTHLLNVMFVLSNDYDIDFEGIYAQKIH